jgi:hypothetical protein
VALILIGVVGVVFLSASCAVARLDVNERDRLVLWGFDKVFLAGIDRSGRALEPRPLSIDADISNLVAVTGVGRRLVLVGKPRDSNDLRISVIDTQTGRLVSTLPRSAVSVALDPSGNVLAFIGASAPPARRLDLMLWNVGGPTFRVLIEDVRSHGRMTWHPRGDELAFDGEDGWIHKVRVANRQISRIIEGRSPAWSPNGNNLTFRRDQTVYVYDAATSKETRKRLDC